MKWISLEERYPPQDVQVIVAKYDGRDKVKMFFVGLATRYGKHDWVWGDEDKPMGSKHGQVTHWMPMPDAPDLPV